MKEWRDVGEHFKYVCPDRRAFALLPLCQGIINIATSNAGAESSWQLSPCSLLVVTWNNTAWSSAPEGWEFTCFPSLSISCSCAGCRFCIKRARVRHTSPTQSKQTEKSQGYGGKAGGRWGKRKWYRLSGKTDIDTHILIALCGLLNRHTAVYTCRCCLLS